MANALEIGSPRLQKESDRFATCVYKAELTIKVGPIQTMGTFRVDQLFGTDAIMRVGGPSARVAQKAFDLLADPTLVFSGGDYLFASNALIRSQYGPLTGYSENLSFSFVADKITEIENMFATPAVLLGIDGILRYRFNQFKGLRPKNSPGHSVLLTTIHRDSIDDPIKSLIGTVALPSERCLRLELNYLQSYFSLYHYHLTGCLPPQTAINLIQVEEAKTPEERLSRFLADIWANSGGLISHNSGINN